MKAISTFIFISFFTIHGAFAQVFRISVLNQEGAVFGDFAKKDLANNAAGYAEYSSLGGLEFNYYTKQNIGFGIRWTGTFYGRDFETYETDLASSLGITNGIYDVTQSFGFWSVGSDFGVSYLKTLSPKLQLEPYAYIGFRGLISPVSNIIYQQNNETFEYRTKSQVYFGIAYSAGLKLHWNIANHFGLYFSLAYDGSSFAEFEERSIRYSYNSLEIIDRNREYAINTVNLGIGLSFRFGKGLN